MVAEALLLSLALADRINGLKQEMAAAQEKAIRNLQRADELKNRFLAVVSHELRTPLNGVLGLVGGLLAGARGPLSESQQETLRLVEASGRRLLGLIDEILDFTTARERGLRLDRSACRIDRIVIQSAELMQPLFEAKGVGLELRLPEEPLPEISCDARRIQQVLLNLLGNALKFTDEGRVVVSAEVKEGELCILVEDTGVGIRDEDIPKVFDPLETAGAHRGGAGLGLAISRELIEAHGGHMELRSSAGHGTRVIFCLPRDAAAGEPGTSASIPGPRADQPALSELPAVAGVPSSVGKAGRPAEERGNTDESLPEIWVVDDDPVNLEVAGTLLDPQEFRVRRFRDGRSVLEALFTERQRPDLILLDLMMPDVDGFEVCARVREHFDALHLPILVVTARVDEQSIARAFEQGCNDYLVKPFVSSELLARVRAHLSAHALVEQMEENKALKAEIKLRRQTEALLLRAQSILGNLIEFSSEGVIAFDQDGHLLCANSAAQALLGLDEGQQYLDDLSPTLTRILLYSEEELRASRGELNELLELRGGKQVQALIRASCYEGGRIYYAVLGSLRESAQTPAQSARLQALDAAFNAVGEAMIERDAGGSVAEPMACPIADKDDQDQLFKTVIVDAMTASLQAWKQYTHRTKIDLAEDSGLWTVYLDKSTPVTRTLDRYLKIDTVPKRPRWRRVLQTIEFVMEHVPPDTREHAMLAQLRDRIIELSP